MANPKFEIVFCDDIRQEANGKHILIGVYSSDLVPPILPAHMQMAVWIRMTGVKVGAFPFSFELQSTDKTVMVSMEGDANIVDASAPVVLVFSGFFVEVKEPGKLKVFLTINKTRYLAGELVVKSPPTATQ